MSNLKPNPPRVLVTKIGLDGHDRGSRIVASYLRDAGMEVIYTNPWTDHLLVPKLMQALEAAGLAHIRVIVGGIVPDLDEIELQKAGVSRVFHPGSSREDIVETVDQLAAQALQARPTF
jgi:methylmalonyl-CoA mutase C-terminal domain/subunit